MDPRTSIFACIKICINVTFLINKFCMAPSGKDAKKWH